jgi:sugar lactone lactonase YvrE
LRSFGLDSYVIRGGVALALLAGCGGAQPPLAAPGASLQSFASKKHDNRAGLWMLPAPTAAHSADYAASGPLLYVTNVNPVYNDVTVYHAGTKNPAPVATISDGLNGPAGDCLDSQGTLYVTNQPISNRGSIVEYAFGKTTPLRVITEGIDTPAFCAIDGDGNLWVTNIGGPNATEYLHSSKKPHTVITKDMIYPTGIAIDSSATLYVSNRLSSGGDVVVFPAGSTTPSRTITDGVTSPAALAIDARGDLYVTNIAQNNIEEYSPGGNHPFRTITQGLSTPGGLTVSQRGWLFAANFERNTIVEFRPGSARLSKRSVSNGLHAPSGLAIYPAVLP